MTPQEILTAYKSGILSTQEVKEELAKLKKLPTLEYPLSEGQKGLWMLQKMVPSMSAYNVPICFRTLQRLDMDLFRTACELLLKQYPILTHTIGEREGVPYQRVQPSRKLYFKLEDVSSLTDNEITDLLNKESKRAFLLNEDNLMRVHVLSKSDQEFFVLIVIHHIIFDGSSFQFLIRTLLDSYKSLLHGEEPVMLRSAADYHDFVVWEQNLLKSDKGKEHLQFWQEELSGPLPTITFYGNHPDLSLKRFDGQTCTHIIDGELARKIRELSSDLKMNISVIFLGIFKVLLNHYTALQDIIVGMPTMGRPEERFESLIGYFINMMAIRTSMIGETSFSELLKQLQRKVLEGMSHAAYPFPALVKALNIPRSTSASPVFQVSFAFQNFIMASEMERFQEKYQKSLDVEFMEGIHQEGEYELEMEIHEQREFYILNLKYNRHIFTHRQIEEMMAGYLTLIDEVYLDPAKRSGSYPVLSPQESRSILKDLNNTESQLPDLSVHELFEEQVLKDPEQIAVMDRESSLTYGRLDQRAGQLALHLLSYGLKPESLVGICVERSIDMVIATLAVLKAGCAYLPIDPQYPIERISLILKSCETKVVLTRENLADLFSGHVEKLIYLENSTQFSAEPSFGSQQQSSLQRVQSSRPESGSRSLAYVMFTSGTTGTPKGVCITHRNIVRLISHRGFNFLKRGVRILQYAPLSFDASTFEIWGALCSGATLVVAPPGTLAPEELGRTIADSQVSVVWLTSALFSQMAQHHVTAFKGVKYLLAGGDVLYASHIKRVFQNNPGIVVINGYGPTENTTFSTLYVMNKDTAPDSFVPIGRPLDNTTCYIVNENLLPVPFGVEGELLVGGAGLARGYLNNPELTEDKFIKNPFDRDGDSTLYRTGDLVRYLPDNNIQFLGRRDNQVKIRGFRIEPGEVENRLSLHPDIKECVVVVKERESGKMLVAYYVEKSSQIRLEPADLSSYLKRSLPSYMIPSFFICLKSIPVTLNGKADRKKLAQQRVTLVQREAKIPPDSKIQMAILKIWRETLEVDNIGVDDGFFDVGGDSITAVMVSERIKNELSVDFNTTTLFKYPNIREISRFLAEVQHHTSEIQSQTSEVQPNTSAALKESRSEHKIAAPPVLKHVAQKNGEECKDGQNYPDYDQDYAPDYNQAGESLPDHYRESLAVIGISCRFPGAPDHYRFWDNLRQAKESIRFYSHEELRAMGVAEDLIKNIDYVPIQSTIEDKDKFDPAFFNLSPRDAQFMDPQFRLLMQHSWQAFEDAGYIPKKTPRTAVFISTGNNFYNALPTDDGSGNPDGYAAWVLAQNGTIPTMISHKLGLKGPSFFVQSNCSSSLVGLYSAFQSIRSNEADYALVGAANIFAQSSIGYIHKAGLNFSSDGHLKAFDASADGMVGGEGVAAVLLKRAVDAVRDRDHIYAILRGISVNNDGSDKVGYYAPAISGQTEVIRKVMERTGVNPESISYIEAHGTGTKLGDPIEFNALCDHFRKFTSKKQFCGIGSVKTNIGHLDCAAGLAGLIKLSLSLHNREIPPSLNYKKANPQLNIESSPFYVVKELEKLPPGREPHLTALSSFGLGGTNTHAILEQYKDPEVEPEPPEDRLFVVPLSAKRWDILTIYAKELLSFLRRTEGSNIKISSVAHTLQSGREGMSKRVAFIVRDLDELMQQLELFVKGEPDPIFTLKGDILSSKDTLDLFETDEDHRELVHHWIKKGKFTKVASLWVRGLDIEWSHFHPDGLPIRISLPTYPFAKESHPLSNSSTKERSSAAQSKSASINPLLNRIDPALTFRQRSGLVFKSAITPELPMVAGHRANGFPMLPVSAAIEMVSSAMREISGSSPIEIEEIYFLAPVLVMESITIHLVLSQKESDGSCDFRIESDQRVPTIFCHGRIKQCEEPDEPFIPFSSGGIADASSLMSTEEFFKRLSISGMEYDGELRCLNRIWSEGGQVFSELEIRDHSNVRDHGRYRCHPLLLDTAMQTRIGLRMERAESEPITWIRHIKIFSDLPMKVVSRVTFCEEQEGYQLSLLNHEGRVLLTMGQIGSAQDSAQDMSYALTWVKKESPEFENSGSALNGSSDYNNTHVDHTLLSGNVGETLSDRRTGTTTLIVLSGSANGLEKSIGDYFRDRDGEGRVILIKMEDHTRKTGDSEWICGREDLNGFDSCLESIASVERLFFLAGSYREPLLDETDLKDICLVKPEIELLRLIKYLKQKNKNVMMDCFTITIDTFRLNDDRVSPTGGGITGLSYSMAQSDRHLRVRNLDINREDLADLESRRRLISRILSQPPSQRGELIKLMDGVSYGQQFVPIDRVSMRQISGLREGGVYVIAGGSGNVGMVITRALMEDYKAKIIWIGRSSETSDHIVSKIESMSVSGMPPLYIQADVTDLNQLQSAVTLIKRHNPIINGAIFSSVVMNHDNTIEKSSEEEFSAVVDVKVQGGINFYMAFKDEPLDFLCYFSSAQTFSFSGAVHFSGYAAAITAADALIRYLHHHSKFPVGTINWGFWKSPVKAISLNSPLVIGIMNSTGFLEKREGFECFRSFTGLLTQGILNQSLCLRVSEPVRKLMDINYQERAVMAEQAYGPLLQRVLETVQVDSDILLPLLQGINPEEFYRWITRLLISQLRHLGILNHGDEPQCVDDLRQKGGITDRYERWFVEAVQILVGSGHLTAEDGMVKALYRSDEDEETVWEKWDLAARSIVDNSEMRAHMELVVRCIRNLPDILTGRVPATDIIFPGSSMSMVETIYKKSALSDYFNTIVADITSGFVRKRLRDDPEAAIRIIEIGAGTGGTTAMVLPGLREFEDRIHYMYTDISKSFLLFAQKSYGEEFPFLRYQVWNIEKPAQECGVEAGTYDIAIATNVLHATADITQTLIHAKAALKSNGVIIINEVVDNTIIGTLSFGLTDGWWLYRDGHLRISGSPMVNVPTWKRLLSETGFREISLPAQCAIQTGQQIIVAESDGFIRQTAKPPSAADEISLHRESVTVRATQRSGPERRDVEPAKGYRPDKEREIYRDREIESIPVTHGKDMRTNVISIIKDELSKALKMPVEAIEEQVAFSDYGVDSIISVNFIDQINRRLGIELNTAIIFDYSTVSKLSDYILTTHEHRDKKMERDLMEELEEKFWADEISSHAFLEALGNDK